MPEQNREYLVWRDESAVAVHGADAVGVSVKSKPGVEMAFAQSLAQRFDVRLDGFGIHAAEQRIARAANFLAFDSVAAEKFAQQTSPRSMHGINEEPEFRCAYAVPVNQSGKRFQIRRANVERADYIFS